MAGKIEPEILQCEVFKYIPFYVLIGRNKNLNGIIAHYYVKP